MNNARKTDGEGEPGIEPRPPMAFLQTQPGRSRVGAVPYQALPLLSNFLHIMFAWAKFKERERGREPGKEDRGQDC